MHPDFKGWLIACACLLLVVTLNLGGCTTKQIPIIKPRELAKVASDVVEPANRPPARKPATTPLPEVEKQWAADRKGWGDEADRGDTARRILCAERGNKIFDDKGVNTCLKLKR